jgi:hypothetical protein
MLRWVSSSCGIAGILVVLLICGLVAIATKNVKGGASFSDEEDSGSVIEPSRGLTYN